MKRKIALGKGIGALIGGDRDISYSNNSDLDKEKQRESDIVSSPVMIHVEQIQTNPGQPRKIFNEKELEELSQSIKEHGVLQPVILIQKEGGFELVAGERRLRACKKLGIERIPAILKRITDKEKMIISITENIQRSDLNCVEEALAYFQLMNDFQLTQEEVAKKLGKERSTIANYLRILKLPRYTLSCLQKDLLSFGHAKVLASLKDEKRAEGLTKEVVENSISVRELEERIKNQNLAPEKRHEEKKTSNVSQYDDLKVRLEEKTGFHFAIKSGSKGSGAISLKFSNKEEFNNIYEFLLSR